MEVELDDAERRDVGQKAREAILTTLRALGGEGQRHEVLERAKRDGGFTERQIAAAAPENARSHYPSFVDYRLSWTLSNLKKEGLIENPHRSVWCLAGTQPAQGAAAADGSVSERRLAELRAMTYRHYLRTPEWKRTRALALERAGHRCSMDRSHAEGLDVHHNTYERIGAELMTDLIVLCRACHQLHHDMNGLPRRPRTAEAAAAMRAAASIPPPASSPMPTPVQPSRPSILGRLLGRG